MDLHLVFVCPVHFYLSSSLGFLATAAFQTEPGGSAGVSQPTTSWMLQRLTFIHIFRMAIHYTVFPKPGEKTARIMNFHAMPQFPNVTERIKCIKFSPFWYYTNFCFFSTRFWKVLVWVCQSISEVSQCLIVCLRILYLVYCNLIAWNTIVDYNQEIVTFFQVLSLFHCVSSSS